MKNSDKYFWIAIVFIGSIGVWWSIILEPIDKKSIDWHNVTPNLITYYSAIIFTGNIDYFMTMVNQKKKENELLSGFLNIVFIVILSIIWVVATTILHLKKIDVIALIMCMVGILASWKIWWLANKDNPNFQVDRKPENAIPDGSNLPGDTNGYNL